MYPTTKMIKTAEIAKELVTDDLTKFSGISPSGTKISLHDDWFAYVAIGYQANDRLIQHFETYTLDDGTTTIVQALATGKSKDAAFEAFKKAYKGDSVAKKMVSYAVDQSLREFYASLDKIISEASKNPVFSLYSLEDLDLAKTNGEIIYSLNPAGHLTRLRLKNVFTQEEQDALLEKLFNENLYYPSRSLRKLIRDEFSSRPQSDFGKSGDYTKALKALARLTLRDAGNASKFLEKMNEVSELHASIAKKPTPADIKALRKAQTSLDRLVTRATGSEVLDKSDLEGACVAWLKVGASIMVAVSKAYIEEKTYRLLREEQFNSLLWQKLDEALRAVEGWGSFKTFLLPEDAREGFLSKVWDIYQTMNYR
jgi:hypothetical protein